MKRNSSSPGSPSATSTLPAQHGVAPGETRATRAVSELTKTCRSSALTPVEYFGVSASWRVACHRVRESREHQ